MLITETQRFQRSKKDGARGTVATYLPFFSSLSLYSARLPFEKPKGSKMPPGYLQHSQWSDNDLVASNQDG